jgi:polygalacturonase
MTAFSFSVLLITLTVYYGQVVAYKVCNVMDNGAMRDGINLDDAAFSKSFDDCAEGGRVYVPAGSYLLSPFNLTSNIELYLDHGAIILASTNFSSYPIVEPLPSYPDDYNGGRTGPFIGGTNISNARISGHGTIDGQGQAWWDAEDKSQFPYGRGRMIEPMFCSNFSMVGVTVKNPAFWGIHPYACDDLLFENVKFYAPIDSPNTDGLDPDSCSNVIIRNFSATSGDDAIAIKSGRDENGRRFNKPSYNILIEGGVMGHSRGINIGSEMSGHVYNVHVKDVRFVRSDFAVRIKTARGRGGKVKNA